MITSTGLDGAYMSYSTSVFFQSVLLAVRYHTPNLNTTLLYRSKYSSHEYARTDYTAECATALKSANTHPLKARISERSENASTLENAGGR